MTFADIRYIIVCNNLFSKVRATPYPPFFEAVLPGQKAAGLHSVIKGTKYKVNSYTSSYRGSEGKMRPK